MSCISESPYELGEVMVCVGLALLKNCNERSTDFLLNGTPKKGPIPLMDN